MAETAAASTPPTPSTRDRLLWLLSAGAIAMIVLMYFTCLSRIRFPYELEWFEGVSVDQVQRLVRGQPMYVEPSLDFVPHLYTPIYFHAAALLARFTGVSFLPLRVVSLAAATGCLLLTFLHVKRETGKSVPALFAAGFLAATFPLNGEWFDIGRVDTLMLVFLLAALGVMRTARSPVGLSLGGLLLGLAFLTKQSAAIVAIAMVLYVVFEHPRLIDRAAFGATLGLVVAIPMIVMHVKTGGWSTYYTLKVPEALGLGRWDILTSFWLFDLLWPLAPATVVLALYMVRGLRHGERTVTFELLVLTGTIGSSWMSRLHGGGYLNVLQPMHGGMAILLGAALHKLQPADGARTGFRAYAVPLLCGLQLASMAYEPEKHIPTPQDYADGQAFVEQLRKIPGEVFVPMHGFIPTLAGKRSFAHDGTVLSILRTGDDSSARLWRETTEAIKGKRFGAVVIDKPDFRFYNLLTSSYTQATPLPPSFRPRVEPKGLPQMLFVPKPAGAP